MEHNSNTDKLYKIRHSLAHVLAQAVLEIRPGTKLAFGPPIDNGCYYDFDFKEPISSDDFPKIEKTMRRIINEKQEFVESKRPLNEAIDFLQSNSEDFKVEYCKELGEQGETEIGFYQNGSFIDMCAGPHLQYTSEIRGDCFKIDSLAGAYWRGNEKNPQLTRIYCLAFENKKDLKEYTKNRELAKQRDHRKLGKEQEYFMISDQVGQGLPLWLPYGNVIKEELEKYAKELEARQGYKRVTTPVIAKEELFNTSGHLAHYADDMYPAMELEGESKYYLKPMNCPMHHQIYDHRPRSYRELPLRLAEYAPVYRYESSGSLSGLLRVRSICQNDAHIYCTVDQLKEELLKTFQLTIDYYNGFRFEGIKVRYSTHDAQKKDKFVDNPELWDFSEKIVKEVVDQTGIEYKLGAGEAAFYGPKIDFQATSVLGREETIGTTQLDFAQPISFNLKYIGEDGSEHRPYIVHRAPLGSHERTVAFLIEHFGGAFPSWLSPVQVKIVAVNESCFDYAGELEKELSEKLIRVETDYSDNSFNKKVRSAIMSKTPNIIIIGNKEVEAGSVAWKRYCKQKEQQVIPKEEFISKVEDNIANRIMDNFADVEV